jgi:hypothetical protein
MSCTQETRGPRRPVEISYFARIKPTHSMVSDNDVQPLVVNLHTDNRESILCITGQLLSACHIGITSNVVKRVFNIPVVAWIPAAVCGENAHSYLSSHVPWTMRHAIGQLLLGWPCLSVKGTVRRKPRWVKSGINR